MDKHPEYRAYEKQFVDVAVSARGKHRTKGALYQFLEEARRAELPPETCLVVESVSRSTFVAPIWSGMRLLEGLSTSSNHIRKQ